MNFTDPADVSILDLSMETEEFSSMKDNIREMLVIIKYTDSLKSDIPDMIKYNKYDIDTSI